VFFLFAGRYKNLPELRGVGIDFTVLFFTATWCLIALALVSGRMRLVRLTAPVLLMISFTAITVASLFWSSIDDANIDKTLRFFLFTSSSFMAAHFIVQDERRRRRLLRLMPWFCCIILLYYAYSRYVLGIDLADKEASEYANNYLEYGGLAEILFIILLSVAALGSSKQLGAAIIGLSAALFGLVTIGGRGPFVLALLSVPVLVFSLLSRPEPSASRLKRLSILLAGLICFGGLGYAAMARSESPSAKWEGANTIQRFYLELSGEDTKSMDGRREGRRHALERWLEKPIFGWGIGEFRVQDSDLAYTHNLVLEILMEMGLVGAVLFFSACALAVVDCLVAVRDRTSGWVETAIALIFLVELVSHLTVQGYLGDDRVFFAYLGMAIGSRSGAVRLVGGIMRHCSAGRPGPRGPSKSERTLLRR